ncbi:MAG: translocation/assembly module TamB domain-containing protein, partial [Alphaproteobacteria bacterium]|nr:translocation/assembly module TamB domain-containing protein [Alphaproteobacteria bacterium]
AATLSGAGFTLTGLQAHGESAPRASGARSLKISADLSSVAGLPAGLDPLAAKAALASDLILDRRGEVRGTVTLRSPRLMADLNLSPTRSGLAGNLTAHARGYDLAGQGLADLDLTSSVGLDAKGQLSLDGTLHGVARALSDPTVRQVFDGPAEASGHLRVSPDGAAAVSGMTLSSPGLAIRAGEARLAPDGGLSLHLAGRSRDFGPLDLTASGNLDALHLRLAAPRPSPLGLSDLVAEAAQAKGARAGESLWRLQARATSDYGPVTLDSDLDILGSSTSLKVKRARLGDLGLVGVVKAGASGLLSGDLSLSGEGLKGVAHLSEVDGAQAARVSLSGHGVRLPLHPDLTLRQGKADLVLQLHKTGPTLTGAVSAAGAHWNGITVSRLSLDLGLHRGEGEVRFDAAGSAAAPFALKGVARVSPGLIRLSGEGSAAKVPIQVNGEAVLHQLPGGYRLDPTTIVLPHGRILVSGENDSAGIKADLALEGADLGVLRAFAPDLDVAGVATGQARFDLPASGAMPTAHASLQVLNFTRSGMAAAAAPMDLALTAELSPAGGALHALARQGGATIGRLQLTLDPRTGGGGAAWWDRLTAAQARGGLRYQGPAEALWTLGSLGGQTLSGPLAIGVDLSGRLDQPELRGVVRGVGLSFTDPDLGLSLKDIALDGRFDGARLQLRQLSAKAGEGTVEASGYADLSAAQGFPVDLHLKLARARLLSGAPLDATMSGEVAVTHDHAKGGLIAGSLTLDKASYQIGSASADDIVELVGVRRKDAETTPPAPEDDAFGRVSRPSAWKLDVGVNGGSHIFVSGMGLDAEWRAALKIAGDLRVPRVTGDVNLVRGSYEFAGRKLTLSRGVIHLNGANPPNPTLDIQATTTAEGVTANINIAGTANRPQITFSSSPALPEDQILARLLFGASASNISAVQAVQLAASLNALRSGGSDPTSGLRKAIKLDRLSVYAADPTLNRGTSVGAGKYIGSRIYVEVTTDAKGYAATQVEIALTKAFRLLSQVGTMIGGTSIDLQYTKQY